MGYVKSVAWSPSGQKQASGSDDQTVVVWDAEIGAKVAQLEGHAGRVEGKAWSQDGSRLASCCQDKVMLPVDVEYGTMVSAMTGYVASANVVTWNTASNMIASVSEDHSVAMREAGSGSGAESNIAGSDFAGLDQNEESTRFGTLAAVQETSRSGKHKFTRSEDKDNFIASIQRLLSAVQNLLSSADGLSSAIDCVTRS